MSKKEIKNTNEQSASGGARAKKKKKNVKKKRIILAIFAIILVSIIIAVGIFVYKSHKNGGGLQGMLSTMVGHDENTKKNLSSIEFLLLGESGGLSDTIIACSYNPNTQKASMLSIPRDTFVGKNEEKATASDKINSIYNRTRKPEKTVEAVNSVTGLNLEYYVLVDTKALQQLVDTIGGVEFDVPIDMQYEDTSEENYLIIDLKKGVQKINGKQAEQLVRFRHNSDGTTYPSSYGEEDIGRMRTQREFITAALKQTLKPGNIFKIGEFIDIMQKNVKTNIPISVIKDYVPYAVEFKMETLQTGALPGDSKKLNGVWVYLQDKSKSQKLVADFFFNDAIVETTDEEEDTNTTNSVSSETSTTPTFQVLNGSDNAANLKKVVDKIKELGYNVVKVGNTNVTSKTTITNRTKQEETIGTSITKALNCGTVQSGKNTEKADFTIVIGKDYK